tara:strand:- start:184 stop:1827 length:1644 start_codon:yes stop_codon:yes gene_type:complete
LALDQEKIQPNEAKPFTVPYSLAEINENLTININTTSQSSKEKIINQAFKFHLQGAISDAAKYYKLFINKGFEDERVFSNYGKILRDVGNLKEAEIVTRKAIKINPNFADAYSNLGNILRDHSNLKEAENSYRKAIKLNPNFAEAYSNLGGILSNLDKLQDAELSTRKAIEIKPDLAQAHLNLGAILTDLGKLQEAEISYKKAIEINPDYSKAYYFLSLLNYSEKNKTWQNQLFSRNILNNKLKKDQIDIYFARANILHNEKKYRESSTYLELANKLKLEIINSKIDLIISKSKRLIDESEKRRIDQEENIQYPKIIFIVGMSRSGSTLVESILSMNEKVFDLGEVNLIEESFIEQKNGTQGLTLAELYLKKVKNKKTRLNTITDKCLYNYQYAGIIANQIPNAKIIHCFRNPLDNILSIYRANFANKKNNYYSSLADCAKVYLDQEAIMTEYKNRFRSKIYDLNYDSLVSQPNQEIKDLISWLGWEWNDSYLTPHLNPRSISTASNVQVRSAINSRSTCGWKNYKIMLKPAIEILIKTDRYKDITS